jgi:hypothetical protein
MMHFIKLIKRCRDISHNGTEHNESLLMSHPDSQHVVQSASFHTLLLSVITLSGVMLSFI